LLLSQSTQFLSFEVDHIIAEKHGGPTTLRNLCLSCLDCNRFKGSDVASVLWDGEEPTIVPLFDPRIQNWEHHFLYDPESGFIEGLTPVGYVTIALLRWNELERRIV
jgi:hypothetical protein